MKKKLSLLFVLLTISLTSYANLTEESTEYAKKDNFDGKIWYQITSSAPWSGRHGHSCTEFKGKIWLLGGLSSSTYNNEIWSSPDGTNWTLEGKAAWSKRGYHATTVFDNKLWVFGGNNPNAGTLDDVWSSSDGVNWTLVTSSASWPNRCGAKSFVYNNKLWIVGGTLKVNNEFCNDVWSSADGTNWTQVTSSAPWEERGYHESFVFKEKMWVMGGVCGKWVDYSKDVWSSSDGTNWTLVTTNASCAERHYTSAAIFDDKIWICGSYHHGEQNDVWSSPNGSDWTLETEHATWSDRCAQSVFVFDNKLWIAGGEGRNDKQLNDVWCTASYFGGLHIVTTKLPKIIVGEKYYVGIKAVEGTPPYTWEIENGILPDGIFLVGSRGILSGIPLKPTNAFFVVKVTGANGQTNSMPLSIKVLNIDDQTLAIQNVSKARFVINWRKHIKKKLDDVDSVWLRMLFDVPEGFTLTEGLPVTAFFGAYPIDGFDAVISPNGKRAVYREGNKADEEFPIVKMVLRIKKKGDKEIGLLYAVVKFADLYGELGAPNEDIENGKITVPIEMLLGTYEGSKSIEMLYNSKKDRKAKGNYTIRN